jgi:two-component system, LytTR family, response regulator
MKRIKAILVDDNQESLEVLEMMLLRVAPNVDIVGAYLSATESITAIRTKSPDVVFLDVEMPDLDGFELKRILNIEKLPVVYVTGKESKALQALRAGAVDFLQKPFSEIELLECLNRVNEFLDKNTAKDSSIDSKKILVNRHDKAVFINEEEIIFVKASGAYSIIYYSGGRNVESSKPIAHYESILNTSNFIRIHRSYLVNFNHISDIVKKESVGILNLTDGHNIELAKNQLSRVFSLLDSGE